jgi:hypothetical protein
MGKPFERRLVFAISEPWSGWFCDRCCWSRSQPRSDEQRAQRAHTIQEEFAAHHCEDVAIDISGYRVSGILAETFRGSTRLDERHQKQTHRSITA